jgi:hypothetical protein
MNRAGLTEAWIRALISKRACSFSLKSFLIRLNSWALFDVRSENVTTGFTVVAG